MRKVLAAAALLFVAACSDSTGPDAHVGSYTLTSINSQGLPQIVAQDASGTLEITGGLVTLRSDGSFTDRIDYRFDDGFDVVSESEVTTGFYTISGNNITFDTDDGFTYSMALSGRSLTQTEPGITLVYRR